jgi:DNA-binding NarL/FixJ family response regulator
MRPRAVVVAHRDAMVAEGIASALDRYPSIVPIGAVTTAEEGERLGTRADAVALDQYLPGALPAASRLRRHGVRVVLLGGGGEEDEGVRVSTRAPIASLASALVPEASPAPADHGGLTPREREVLSLVARGMAAKQVARYLRISPKTVEQHKTRIFSKLGVPNQTAAVSVVVRDGLADRGPWEQVGAARGSA